MYRSTSKDYELIITKVTKAKKGELPAVATFENMFASFMYLVAE